MAQSPPLGTLAETVMRQLRDKIDMLDAVGADRLPPERTLALELGVSRRVIRQALASLEADGQIARARGRGRGTIIVRPPSPGSVREHAPSEDDANDLKRYTSPLELMETRLALEPAIAALAATHASSRDLEDLRMYLEKSRTAQDHSVWERWDGAMHKAIGRSTYNGMLMRFSDMLDEARKQTAWGRLRKATLTSKRQQLYTRQHEEILAAIADRHPEEAAKAMHRHLLTVKRTLIDQIDDALADTDD
ncbi:FCD domain-containing protein [Castellaniella sp. GW247-6E4]|uniref:FadR/GntR family transcriptional regulator n=1 Tax=Castellaniella sp. GW247-6E4 TaxID=3140380 RepID=UPI003315F50D